MKKEHTYVECQACNWRLQQESYDPHTELCKRCNNTRKVISPKEILCNLCGECMCPIGTMNEQVPHGLYKAKVIGGYDSYHLSDMSVYVFSFCEKCLRQLFIQCKIKPDIRDHIDERSWDEDQKYYEYMIWKDNGGHHQAYLNGKCNAEKDCFNKAVYTRFHNDTEFTENCACEEHKELRSYSNSKLTAFIPNVLKPFL
jgi:hypothetical protein